MKPDITVLLLNWKRPEQLKQLIEGVRAQSVKAEIFVWNNNPEDHTDFGVDLQINASKNLMCWPRWFMGVYASADVIAVIDDDILLRDEHVLRDCIENLGRDGTLCYTGVLPGPQANYFERKHIRPAETENGRVCIPKGQFIVTNKWVLNRAHMAPHPDLQPTLAQPSVEDDVCMAAAMPRINVPSFLKDRIIEQPDDKHALWHRGDHAERRSRAMNLLRL